MRHTYENWDTDMVYVYSDGTVFVSPDGIGRYFYDTVDDAYTDYDGAPIVYLDIEYES